MVCGKCNRNNTNIVCYCNSCFQNARLNARQEGRVEGAIGQLKEEVDFLRRFVDGYVYLDEVHQRYLDKIKCLKELESKGVN